MRWTDPNGYWVSDEPPLVDVAAVHHWLATLSYWAQGRPYDVVARSIEESLPLGLYGPDGNQAGFCRGRKNFAPLDAVIGEDCDAIAFGQAEAQQGIGEPARAVVPLRKSHRTFKIPGANAIW